MNDANQGADRRRRQPSGDDRTGQPDGSGRKHDRLEPGFDPGTDAEAGALAGMPGPDAWGAILRDALTQDVEALTPSDPPSPVAADEPSSLDAAIASYEAAWAGADLDDETWGAALLAEPALRGDLVDVAHALEAVDTAPEANAVGAHVRQAALGAFDRVAAAGAAARAADEPKAGTPRRPAAPRTPPPARPTPLASWLGWRAAAAVLLVALGVTVVAVGGLLHDDVTGNGAGAEAGMRLDHVTEHHLDDAGFVSRAAWVPVGEAFTPSADRVVVFGLGEASHVVVGDGDRLRVAAGQAIDARLMERARADLGKAGVTLDLAAVLRLEAGEAQLDSAGRRPVFLAVGDELLLVLERGQCHVAIDPGAEAGAVGPAIALAADARARVYRAANGDRAAKTFELAGPMRVLLGATGPTAFGTPAASLFRDLELFGGALDARPQGDRAVRIQATLWRTLAGQARRTNGRFRLTGRAPVRLAFRPQATLYGATALRVWLRAPEGTRVVVRPAKASDPSLGSARLRADTRRAEPGVATVEIPLRSDWHAQLGGGELVLEIAPSEADAPGDALAGYFEGAAFVMGDAALRLEDPETSK